MLKQRCVPELRNFPIQILQPPMNRRIAIPNRVLIRLKQRHIDGIETDDRDIEPNIDFGNGRAEIKRPAMAG
jgi:hypothetical protein